MKRDDKRCYRRDAPYFWFVYFIQAEKGGLIKIGQTGSPKGRIKELQAYCPDKLKFLAILSVDSIEIEKIFHIHFEKQRKHGEWFEPTQELMDIIDKINKNSFDVEYFLFNWRSNADISHCSAVPE